MAVKPTRFPPSMGAKSRSGTTVGQVRAATVTTRTLGNPMATTTTTKATTTAVPTARTKTMPTMRTTPRKNNGDDDDDGTEGKYQEP